MEINHLQIETLAQEQLTQDQVERITTLVDKINSLTEKLGSLTERLGIVEHLCKTFTQQICKLEKTIVKIEDDIYEEDEHEEEDDDDDDEDDDDEDDEDDDDKVIRFLPQS
jgi:chromosome segregation ATPase